MCKEQKTFHEFKVKHGNTQEKKREREREGGECFTFKIDDFAFRNFKDMMVVGEIGRIEIMKGKERERVCVYNNN